MMNSNCDAGACQNGHALWFNSFNFLKQRYKLPLLFMGFCTNSCNLFVFELLIWTSLCHWNLGAMPSLCEVKCPDEILTAPKSRAAGFPFPWKNKQSRFPSHSFYLCPQKQRKMFSVRSEKKKETEHYNLFRNRANTLLSVKREKGHANKEQRDSTTLFREQNLWPWGLVASPNTQTCWPIGPLEAVVSEKTVAPCR